MILPRHSGNLGPVNLRRSAFTLVEMLVALAVMVVALAIVAQVFSITTRTASQASAIAEAHEAARAFLDELRADLDAIDPAESVLAIYGRTQVAALTPELRQANSRWRVMVGDPRQVKSGAGFDPRLTVTPPPQFSDPRADILMFFTERQMPSLAPPTGTVSGPPPQRDFNLALQRGAKISPSQVVYGHASLAQAAPAGSSWSFSGLTHVESSDPVRQLSPLPLARWQLVRRQALVYDPPGESLDLDFTPQDMNRVMACYSDVNGLPGDAVTFEFSSFLQWMSSPTILSRSPYPFKLGDATAWNNAELDRIADVLYPANNAQRSLHQIATLVERPPPELQTNMGLRRLPACAWFEVEFLMPEDPRNGRNCPDSAARADTPRWVSVPPGAHVVFVPDSEANRTEVIAQHTRTGAGAIRRFAPLLPETPVQPPPTPPGDPRDPSNYDIRLWPYALRVTVRVFDSRGRLSDPIVRTLVHRFD